MPWHMDRLTPAELHMVEAAEDMVDAPVEERAPAPARDPFARVPDALRQL